MLGIVPILAIGVLLAAVCLQTRQESWSYPEAFAGAMFLVSGRRVPARGPARRCSRSSASSTRSPGGSRASGCAVVPDGPSSIGGAGSLWTAVTGTAAPDATTIVVALCVTGALATLAATAIFRSSERRARELGLLDRTTGS